MHFKIRSVLGVICTGVLLASLIIASAAWFTARFLDEAALSAQTKIARLGVADIYSDLQGRLVSSAYRDTTYQHIVLNWDILWIEREMTNYLPSLGIYRVAILDTNGVPVYIGQNWTRVRARPELLKKSAGMSALLDFRYIQNTSPHVNTGVVVVGGKPYFAAAARILPVVSAPAPGMQDYTLVFFKPAVKNLFYSLSLGFRAQDVDVTLTPAAEKGRTNFPLADASDVPRAYLSWQPDKPGTQFLWVVLPVLFAILGILTGLLIYFVSRWQKVETRLIESEAHDRAMREEIRVKAIFIGNISHELRTPLNAILGFAEMLEMQVFGALGSARYKEYVDHIIGSGRELLRMVNDLIEIARIRSKDTAREREPIDAAATLLKVMDSVRPMAEEKHIRLDLGECTANGWCLGSELSLNTALTKMVETAIAVTGREKHVVVSILRQSGRLMVIVTDQGAPTPDEMLEQVNGELYMFSGDHLVAHKGGAGLNFEIAKGLARLMGGSFRLERGEFSGNRSVLDLPAAEIPESGNPFHVPEQSQIPPNRKAETTT